MTNLSPVTVPAEPEPTPTSAPGASAAPSAPRRRTRHALLPRWSPSLAVGTGLVVAVGLFGLIGPYFVGDPNAIDNIGLTPPSAEHIMGTTQTGQDVFYQLAYATRGSLQIGLLVGLLATLLSAFVGIVGGFLSGMVDEAFSLLSNVMLVIPGLPLVIVISAFVPADARGLWTIALVLAITGWAASARVLRAQTLSLRNRDYVAAARVSGEKSWRIVSVEILPNLLPVIASQFVFAVIWAILSEAGLAFLGLGSSGATLGTMLYYAQNGFALQYEAWWWFVPPGALIAAFGCGLSLINFSIDEIINPKLRAGTKRSRRARAAARSAS